ncbi:unnamed protein product [Bathycoccus prasinos]|mmetsp:Transcript_181/g.614  ORF Transcript_181/g.614 Transcript_181/m.614 type:complete len:252 (-) Transcript_181:132-887(-)
MFEAKTYLQSRERAQKREVDLTENLKQHETFKRLVEHSTRVSRGDWLFRKQNVDEKIREEIRMEEMLRKKEEREEKEAMKRREEELEELEEKRRRNGGSGGNGGMSCFSPEDDPLPSSADGDEYLREMKEKLDALRSEREQEMTKEMKRREREEERRRMRGLTESREDVVGGAVDEEDYERKKREIEKLTRALDVRMDLNRQTEKRRAMEREREEEKKKEREFADNFERERERRERDVLHRKRKEARELQQ